MSCSGLFRLVALVRTGVSEQYVRLPVTAKVLPSSPILTLMMEEIRSSETLVLTRVTQRKKKIPDDGRRVNLKPSIFNK
jgi:hypothetical protein